MEAVAGAVRANGGTPLIVTDQVVEGVPVVRLGTADGHFRFDLAGSTVLEGRTASTGHRRRRR